MYCHLLFKKKALQKYLRHNDLLTNVLPMLPLCTGSVISALLRKYRELQRQLVILKAMEVKAPSPNNPRTTNRIAATREHVDITTCAVGITCTNAPNTHGALINSISLLVNHSFCYSDFCADDFFFGS
jgi:hypothetical protein